MPDRSAGLQNRAIFALEREQQRRGLLHMRATFALAAAALSLGACQSAEEKRAAETGEIDLVNASSEQTQKLVRVAEVKNRLQPGNWRLTVTPAEVDVSGLTPAEQASHRDAIARFSVDQTACRSADELKPLDLKRLARVAGTCTFARYRLVGGKLDAVVDCRREKAPASHMVAQGTVGAEAFDVTVRQRIGSPGQPGHVAMTLRATGRRLGNCPA
jgi:Holliday junction resolvase-like predicted endonuclease